jgi:hypothetical protein
MPQLLMARSALMAGSAALLVGVLGLIESLRYPFGTAGQIGPAIFPLGLSTLLIVAGLAIFAEAYFAPQDTEAEPKSRHIATILAIAGGPVAFALVVERFGLIPAVTACVLISSLADRELKLRTTLIVAGLLSIGCWLVFIYFLRLPLRPIAW